MNSANIFMKFIALYQVAQPISKDTTISTHSDRDYHACLCITNLIKLHNLVFAIPMKYVKT